MSMFDSADGRSTARTRQCSGSVTGDAAGP
jgi:hypothetical protein